MPDPCPLPQQTPSCLYLLGQINGTVSQVLDEQRQTSERLAKMEERIAVLEEFKIRVLTVAALVGVIAGAAGTAIAQALGS